MIRTKATPGIWRSVCLTLAALALVFKVAIPAGYMVDDQAAGGFKVVLCTAQGQVVLDAAALGGEHHAPEKPGKSATHDAPCAFTGHGAAFVASEPLAGDLIERVAYAPLIVPVPSSTFPGQGLSAPPLPARGPPHTA